jgi:hypothetical protein
MERVEILAASLFVLRTRQLSPTCWCCDVWERHPDHAPHESEETFLLEDFGESELEAVAMALSDAYRH